MTVTKDVIRDLMPLYLADEASPDTRRLVEEYLRAHPEETPASEGFTIPKVDPPGSVEAASLDRTRKLYTRRTTTLAAALAVSYSVFSFRFNNNGIQFVLFRDLPIAAWILLAAAIPLWLYFFTLERRWATAGLTSSGHFSKAVWMLGGALAFLPYAFVASYQFSLDEVRSFCVVGAFAGLAIGQALHRPN